MKLHFSPVAIQLQIILTGGHRWWKLLSPFKPNINVTLDSFLHVFNPL